MSRTIAARQLITGSEPVDLPLLTIEDGVITDIRSMAPQEAAEQRATFHYPDAVLVPAYVDVHIHGCAGHDVMEGNLESLEAISRYLPRHGVGAFLPTTVTSPQDETLRALSCLTRQIQQADRTPLPGAAPLGIHLEGPFLSHRKRGVHTDSLLQPPSIEVFDRLWQAAEGRILLMTVAPELPGSLDLIAHATALGVRCSMGHTDASFAQAQAGHLAGAVSATHTFNAMRALDHRDPGVVAFVLNEDGMFAEIIADGLHVDPSMVRLFFKMKGAARTLLVTDGISATGMPDGHYKLGELDVEVIDGRCTSGGAIAGSTLTLDKGVRNLVEFTGAPLASAALAASRNPATMIGKQQVWGSLEAGRAANLTVLSPTGEVLETFAAGRPMLAVA